MDPVVTWVPSHAAQQRARGYNQAEILARRLAAAAGGIPALSLVRKVARTRHQQALGREERRRNLAGAFESTARLGAHVGGGDIRNSERRGSGFATLPQRTGCVVLVDDVYTTGATAGQKLRPR